MTTTTLLFLIGTCLALFVVFPYLRSGWRWDWQEEKPKRSKRKRGKPFDHTIERLMDAGTNDVAEGWKHYMQVERYEDDAKK